MGNAITSFSFSASGSNNRINFEDVQAIIGVNSVNSSSNNSGMIIISTLPSEFQKCVIRGTIPAENEEALMNNIISGKDVRGENVAVVVYGKNATDDTVTEKYEQLIKLGMPRVCIYTGGMFEWLLLQDVYGAELFPTTGNELDILRYRTPRFAGLSGL
jgi:hypothetical protein